MTEAVDRLGAGRRVAGAETPSGVRTTSHELTTFDGAVVAGLLHELEDSRMVVCLMHPRQSLAHHPMVSWFLRMGASVWTQDTRSPNNDINLVHEQAILDMAAGQKFLRERGFDDVVLFGHSGGGTLAAFYIEQAATDPEHRIDVTPAGRPIHLSGAAMPQPDGVVFLAPHPGQGQVLLKCIDPSVADEDDPTSVIHDLDMYDSANGFVPAPASSRYSASFVQEYRAAQRERVRRIDARARSFADEAAQARASFARSNDSSDRRASLTPRIITTYRTDADPRYTDLTIDVNDRPYGSLFGRRPDLTNFGLVGFGRLTTPDAWLSTWSAFTTNADFARCAAGIHIPAIYIDVSGDQAAFAADADCMFEAIAAEDKTRHTVRGHHFGQPLVDGEPTAYERAKDILVHWFADRFKTVNAEIS
ncbi:alpha/beta hydrolase family protein [Rhodococcus wratislaviensis]|uniref:Uncharacterized protein n=1 Tax=Rhodococcus wratislaviensis NBRC 100605 TaxID=1219028 RepID=X0Q5A7_RHOWR|nr:alpha/beta hydrolase [Rhodococcus wratislaviensis]GAF46432.1 hypothetical protein RW1_031_00140 [Rhodococcus wratislaviensis NBRC 100605]